MPSAHDFCFKRLASEEDLPLRDYAGKAMLVVNVASACGYTSQYRELEQLYEAKQARGFVVIGAPCNDFGAQERGGEEKILEFCAETYHVTFPMTGKVEIVGAARRHPFYRWVAAELGEAALPRWNFHKYLISRDGALIDGYASSVAPLGTKLLGDIERALAA